MTGYQIDLKVLEAHERELRALVAALPGAADAANSFWNPEVFGIVGMFAAQVLHEWTDEAATAVEKTKTAGGAVADRFKDMREAYAQNEAEAEALFKGLLEKLEGGK